MTQDTVALTKAKADNLEFASFLEAERADFVKLRKVWVVVDHEVSAQKSSSQILVQVTMDLNGGEASCPGASCRSLATCISIVF